MKVDGSASPSMTSKLLEMYPVTDSCDANDMAIARAVAIAYAGGADTVCIRHGLSIFKSLTNILFCRPRASYICACDDIASRRHEKGARRTGQSSGNETSSMFQRQAKPSLH